MKTLDELLTLVCDEKIEIEKEFKGIHHFAKRPPFKPEPLGFSGFVHYCHNLARGIRSGQENEQTIQRAYYYVSLRKEMAHGQALAQAWQKFPLVTR
jgi:hypothetical protein